MRAKRLHGPCGAHQGWQEQPVIASRNVAGAMPIPPSFTVHVPDPNAGANGPIAFAHEKIDQFCRYTFTVSGAQRDKERNVDETTIVLVISDGIHAESFDIPLGVARDDDLFSLTS